MITFIHPFAFVWLLLAIPLILFYLWRTRRPQAQVVTGALWRKAIPALHPRRAWQKQRWFVSLLVQLAILLVFVTALAEPCWRRPQRAVLVLDATTSMGVLNEDGRSRFEEAKERAQALIQNMGYVDSLAVLVVGEKIGIHSRMSHDPEQLLASFETLPSAGGRAPIDEAVSMARSLITAGTGGVFDPQTNHVILISDGCFPLAETVLKDETVRWIPVGQPRGNVQLETLCAERRTPEKPENAEIFVSLRNFADKPVSGTLKISHRPENETKDADSQANTQMDTLADAQTGDPAENADTQASHLDKSWETQEIAVEIPSFMDGGLLTQTISLTQAKAASICAEFIPKDPEEDALAEDNSRTARLHEAFTFHVTVVTPKEPNTLLENALRSLPSVEVEQKVLKKGTRLAAGSMETHHAVPFTTDDSGVRRFHIMIFDRTLPGKSVFETDIPARNIFFAPPADTPFWKRSETVRDYVLMPWMDGLRSGISTAGVGFNDTNALIPVPEMVSSSPWLFSQSALETNEASGASEEDENFAKQAKTVEMTELTWGLESKNSARNVLCACDLTQSDWILADDFPAFLQYAFDWIIHTPASEARISRGLETGWSADETFPDSDLNIPTPPEQIFTYPGEDIVPMWTLLILIVCAGTIAEWYFYQRRWIE